MEKLFYVCKHCGRLFSDNGVRLRSVMCTGCCEQATYLCTFSWWEGLDLEARRTLVEEYAPSVQLTNDQLMQIPYRRREASPASPQATQAVPYRRREASPASPQATQAVPYRRREASPASPQATQAVPTPTQGERNNVALTLGIIGAVSFAIAGLQMIGITSEASSEGSGGTIFEVYYHAMGWFSFGMAFVSATLGCLGWKR